MSEEKKGKRIIPLGTYTRFGNFKIKRVKLLISDKGTAREENANAKITQKYLDKNGLSEIEAVKIASLEELWHEQIPQTHPMYKYVINLFEANTPECDEVLRTYICNMYFVSSIVNHLYHSIVIHASNAFINSMDEISSKENKEKEYRAIAESILADMLKDLEGYVPKKEKQEQSNKEFEQMVLADELREKLKEEN